MVLPKERRFSVDEAKFTTQRAVTFYIFMLVTAVIGVICWRGEVDDIKNIFNVLVPFFASVIGYWIASSKGSADKDQLSRRNLQVPPPEQGGKTTTVTTESQPMEKS